MKNEILNLVADDKKALVEPLIDSVVATYGNAIALRPSQGQTCSFSRIPIMDNGTMRPSAAIYLSQNGNNEAGLVHELQHLVLPTKTRFFLFGVLPNGMNEFLSAINNTAEHDLMLEDFLAMGYCIDDFLFEGFNTIDYSQEDGQHAIWWKYEYHRILTTKDHVGAAKAQEGNEAVANIRRYGQQFHPGIIQEFDNIDEWLVQKRASNPTTHAEHMRRLSTIILGVAPQACMALNEDNSLSEVRY